ncbi:helix-turn-helix domain-containing protein [Gemmiger formicilis]
MNIGEKIKRIRQHRRMTQKELGELVGLSANRIAQYEMGYRVPKKGLLHIL